MYRALGNNFLHGVFAHTLFEGYVLGHVPGYMCVRKMQVIPAIFGAEGMCVVFGKSFPSKSFRANYFRVLGTALESVY